MTFKRRIGQPTKAQQARQDQCRRWGCIACHIEGLIQFNDEGDAYSPAGTSTINHLTVCGFTQSQDATVNTCTWHHLGHCQPGETTSSMTAKYGPSLAKGSVPFYERYGRTDSQLSFQNELIAGATKVCA